MPYRYWILALLSISTVVNYLDRQALSIVVPTLRREMSLTSSEYGNITTAFLIAYSVGQIIAGGVVDKIGTRLGLAIFVLVWSLAAIAHGFAQTATQFLFLRIVLGLGEAGNWPAGVKAVSEWFSKSERAFSMGVFDGGSAVGAILAPPLVAAIAIHFGWRASFISIGLLGLLWLAFWLRYYRNSPTAPVPSASSSTAVWTILRNGNLWGLMGTRMLATPVWWFYVFWLPDYLGQGRNMSLKDIGMFAWVPYVTVDLGKLIGGRMSDQLIQQGRSILFARKAIMACGAICMMGGLFVVEASSAITALAWVSLATFGFGMWSANILALHADLFNASNIASAVGWSTAASSVGGAVFTWLTGRVVDSQGYSMVFTMAGTTALFAFAWLLFAVNKVEESEALA